MKKINLKLVLLSAATVLAVSTPALAQQDPSKAPPVPTNAQVSRTTETAPGGYGLLGSNYVGLSYDYFKLRQGPPSVGHGLTVEGGSAIQDNLSTSWSYDWREARFGGGTLTRNRLLAGGSMYAVTDWGKPFAEADLGWRWNRAFSTDRSSFAYRLASGLEVKIAPGFAFVPYVGFDRTTRFNTNQWDYGLRANYRLTPGWSFAAKAEYQDVMRTAADITQYSLGANYHF